ncbi:MAG: hypothetical protein JWO22_3261 [Frankiales bacterium]|nr:hypothetical protein [Frankiales bacterium]
MIGKQRSTGICILLAIVTFGIYLVVAPVTFLLHASEVGGLYERVGQPEPVSGRTGLWILLPIAGPLVRFVKVNGALNTYWANVGARPAD